MTVEKIHESLSGRKRIFEMTTLSFEEYVNFKTQNRYQENLLDFFNVEPTQADQLMMEYLRFGGYPRVALEPQLAEKIKLIDEIYCSYLERDASYLLRVEKTDSFGSLIKLLAGQLGGVITYSKIGSDLNLSLATVKKYIWYLEKTFIIESVTPFYRNVRKEITKSPVVYFNDLGLRNYFYFVTLKLDIFCGRIIVMGTN